MCSSCGSAGAVLRGQPPLPHPVPPNSATRRPAELLLAEKGWMSEVLANVGGGATDRHGEAETLAHLGDTQHTIGATDDARRRWQQAVAILDELDHPDAETIRAKLR